MICRNCNKIFADNVAFCPHCGQKTNSAGSFKKVNGFGNSLSDRRGSLFKWAIAAVAVLLVAVMGCATFFILNNEDDGNKYYSGEDGYIYREESSLADYSEISAFEGNSNSDEVSSESNSNTEIEIELIEVGTVYPVVRFKYNESIYNGIIDDEGKIKYYSKANIDWIPSGNGTGYITYGERYDFFDEKREKTFSCRKGELFDSIIIANDGLLLVYKDKSTISKVSHCYGVLNIKGEWVNPLIETEKLPQKFVGLEHKGNGIFIFYEHVLFTDYYLIYNSKSGKSFVVENVIINAGKNKKGVVYASAESGKIYPYNPENPLQGNGKAFTGGVSINGDGEVTKSFAFDEGFGDILVNKSGEYIKIQNVKNNTSYEYNKYKKENISVKFYGENGIVLIQGLDKKYYFTVIDSNVREKFEPIQCGTRYGNPVWPFIVDGNIVAYCGTEETLEIIDINGKKILSGDNEYKFSSYLIFEYEYIYAKTKDGDGIFLDFDGKPLNITLAANAVKG